MKKFLFVPVFVSLFACGNGQQAGAPTEESNAVESVPKLAEMKQASIEYMAKLDTTPTIKGIKEEEVCKVKMNIAGALMFNGFITNIGNAVNLLHEANPTYIVLEIDKKTPKDSVDLLVDGILPITRKTYLMNLQSTSSLSSQIIMTKIQGSADMKTCLRNFSFLFVR